MPGRAATGVSVSTMLEFLWTVLCWLASGLVGVIEYHAEPVVQARWRVTW